MVLGPCPGRHRLTHSTYSQSGSPMPPEMLLSGNGVIY